MIEWIFKNQILYFIITLIWLLFWIAFSIYYRKKKGKLIFGDPNVPILFKENTGSGNSNKNILTKIGGARNCLKVILSDKQLIITPFFPFNLMLMPEIFDLEHFIIYDDILEIRKGFLNSTNILFKLNGESREISLRLRQKEKFLSILKTKVTNSIIVI